MNVAPDEIFEPQTYQEAISSPKSAKWISAMEEEMESLRLNETWQLQPLPKGQRKIKNKWVYKVKYDSANRPTRFKTRLAFHKRKAFILMKRLPQLCVMSRSELFYQLQQPMTSR